MEPHEILQTLRAGSRPQNGRAPRDWYSIRNLAAGEAEIFIYDVIGETWFGGVRAADFVHELRGVNATKIMLRINSPGGDIMDAIAIRNALIEHPANIESHVDGIAASSASWVALAGDTVVMAPSSSMMIHEPFDIVVGDAAAMRKAADVLDKFGDQIADMYAKKAGGTRATWRDRMREETWYTDQEAIDAGLADSIAGQAADVAQNRYDPTILNIFRNTPKHLTASTPANAEPAAPHPDLVKAHLEYQRNWSRRLGAA